MNPSEKYANIIKTLPYEKQLKVSAYVDDTYEIGEPLSSYDLNVRTWKELVQHLVEFEAGTPHAVEEEPFKDYLLYWETVHEEAGPPPWE